MNSYPTALENIGNSCFINTALQCFMSLKSMDSFMQEEFGSETAEREFLQMVQTNMHEMQFYRYAELSDDLLEYIYYELLKQKFNSQQDITDLLRQMFGIFERLVPRTYANFRVMAKADCQGQVVASWGLMLNVPEEDNAIDIGKLISEAVFLEPEEVCECGQRNRIHFYGTIPQCLVITVIKQTFDKVLKCGLVRQSVQVKCEPVYVINGAEYEMKAAAEYIGKDRKGGGLCNMVKGCFGIDSKAKSRAKLEVKLNFMRQFLPQSPIKELEESEHEVSRFTEANEVLSFTPNESSNEVNFRSRARNLPLSSPRAGHYMSYVKRDEGYYHISDAIVRQTNVVKTDDLYVLFYERK